jgi:hypothetical protein
MCTVRYVLSAHIKIALYFVGADKIERTPRLTEKQSLGVDVNR